MDKKKAILRVDVEQFRKGSEVEVTLNKFDEVYNQQTYKIEGTNFWLPESELEFLKEES